MPIMMAVIDCYYQKWEKCKGRRGKKRKWGEIQLRKGMQITHKCETEF